MKRNLELDFKKDEILKLYLKDGKSYKEIAEIFNTSLSSIATRIQEWGKSNPDGNRFNRKFIPKDELYDLYWNKEMHPREIGEIYGCSFSTVHNYLKKYGIKTRTKSQARIGRLNPIYGIGHTEEAKQKMSEAFSNGRKIHSGSWGKGSHYNTPNQGKVWMRSGWETKVADYLTAQGKNWYFEPNWLKLPDGTNYLPDFFIPEENKYIEVKGRYRKRDLFKYEKASKYYDIELWDGIKLLKLGIIDNAGKTEINRTYRK